MNTKNTETKVLFYIELFDAIHCYLWHPWDSGMRVQQNNISPTQNVRDIVKAKQKKITDCFGDKMKEFDAAKQDKFTVKKDKLHMKTNETFLDILCQIINDDNKAVQSLYNAIENEEYDTDAITMDIADYYTGETQIIPYVLQKQFYDFTQNFQRQQRTFAIGYTLYYWEHYKDLQDTNDEHFANIRDHHGYEKHELFVRPRYHNLKYEITHNKFKPISISIYNTRAFKAEEIIFAKKAKGMKSAKFVEKRLHYGIKGGSPLSVKHVLAIALICDCTILCTELSKTFRKNHPLEPIESLKSRNSEFAHFSRLLRETIECYGCRRGGDRNDSNEYINKVAGPFYCGMSVVMPVPSFNIRLNGPTSTSMQIEISHRFSGADGMIIEFDNNWHRNAGRLRMFCCNWVSAFREEDEYLFMGGQYQMRVKGIRILKPLKNYEVFCGALFHFDCMIKGTTMDEDENDNIGQDVYKVLCNLISEKCGGIYGIQPIKIHKYVEECFNALTGLYTQIVLNLHQLNTYFDQLKDLILHCGTDAKLNIFKDEIFDLFPNMNSIIIFSTEPNGEVEYKIDLLEVLSTISSHSVVARWNTLQKVTIKATRDPLEQENGSWLYHAFEQLKKESKLVKYSTYSVSLSQTKDHETFKEDCLTITRN